MIIFMLMFFVIAIGVTIYLKFPQLHVLNKVSKCSNKKTKQTFYLSLATNLGVGNLVGVSTAIYLGGCGVIFWMALFSIFSSALAFLENYYAISSQVNTEHGTFAGTCYTIVKYLNGRTGKILALIFSIFLILTNTLFFPPIQINAIVSVFPKKHNLLFSIILITVILIITFGGIKSILKVTDKYVGLFAILYFGVLVIAIVTKFDQLGLILKEIIISAFNIKTVGISVFFSMFTTSISKSLFSNEAGLGTIPSLTGISDKNEIEVVSYFQLLGVLVDTLVLCSLTGIFIMLYGDGYNGNIVSMLSYCFKEFLGNIGLIIYAVFIIFFGFVSVLGLYYLGENNLMYLVIYHNVSFKKAKLIYQILFIIGIVIGIFGSFSNIMWLVDIGIIILGTINLFVLIRIENCQKMLKNNHKIT